MRAPLLLLLLVTLARPSLAAQELRLRNGDTMRVSEALLRDGRWHLKLPSGIRLTLPEEKVVSLRELAPLEGARAERLSGFNLGDGEGSHEPRGPVIEPQSPRDRELLSRVEALLAARRHGEAERILRDELVGRPGESLRLVLLGRTLVADDRFSEALEPLRLASPRGEASLLRARDLALAGALSRLDRVDEALRALERTPDDRLGTVASLRAQLTRDRDGSAGLQRRETNRFSVHLPAGAERLDLEPLFSLLDAAWDELERELGGTPHERVVVVIYPGHEFWETTGMGGTVGGLYDGKVRVPSGSLAPPSPRLAGVLRHELAHAFVDALTGGRSDAVWHEGVAEHFERSSLRPNLERQLAAAFEQGSWPPAYNHPVAHSRLEWFLGRWGMAGLRDLLREWSRRGTIDAALRAVTGLELSELERAWGEALVEKWER